MYTGLPSFQPITGGSGELMKNSGTFMRDHPKTNLSR